MLRQVPGRDGSSALLVASNINRQRLGVRTGDTGHHDITGCTLLLSQQGVTVGRRPAEYAGFAGSTGALEAGAGDGHPSKALRGSSIGSGRNGSDKRRLT